MKQIYRSKTKENKKVHTCKLNSTVLTNEMKKKPKGQLQNIRIHIRWKHNTPKLTDFRKKAASELTVINTPPQRRKISNSTPGRNEKKETRKSREGKKSRLQMK